MKKQLFFFTCCLLPAKIILAQNVGIGTTAPADKLHVFGGNASIEGSSYPWLSFRNNGALKGYIGVNNNDFRIGTWPGNTTGHISLLTNNNSERVRIMNDGDVGIGVTTPQSLLHIANASGPTQFTIGTNYNNGGYTALYMGTSSLSNGYSYIQGVRSAGTAFGDMMLNPGGGNVGVRTTTTRGIFDIGGGDEAVYIASNTTTGNQRIAYLPGDIFLSPWAGSDLSYIEARRENSSGTTAIQFRTYDNGIASDVLHLSSTSAGGHVGVNTNTRGNARLNIRGFNCISMQSLANNNEWILSLSGGTQDDELNFKYNGSSVSMIGTQGQYVQISDSSLKEQVAPLAKTLDLLKQLKPVEYYFKQSPKKEKKSVGFLAQQAESLFPSLVEDVYNSSGEKRKGINYAAFSVIAIKAIQEQQGQIETLKNELAELKKQLVALAQRSIEIKN